MRKYNQRIYQFKQEENNKLKKKKVQLLNLTLRKKDNYKENEVFSYINMTIFYMHSKIFCHEYTQDLGCTL